MKLVPLLTALLISPLAVLHAADLVLASKEAPPKMPASAIRLSEQPEAPPAFVFRTGCDHSP